MIRKNSVKSEFSPKRRGPKPRPTPLGIRLQAAMDARGVTRWDLAARTFRTPQSVSNWLNAFCRITTLQVEELAKIFECSPAWLAFGIGESGLPETSSINNNAPAATEASISAR